MTNEVNDYNRIVGKIENCVHDIVEIMYDGDKDSSETFQELSYRLAIFLLEK